VKGFLGKKLMFFEMRNREELRICLKPPGDLGGLRDCQKIKKDF